MKEQTLVEMKNHVTRMAQMLQQQAQRIAYTDNLLQTIISIAEFVPGWDEAMAKAKLKNEEIRKAQEDEANKGGVDGEQEGTGTTSEQEEVSQEESIPKQGLDLTLE